MRFIGDVHGKMGDYLHITDGCAESIQVGDFGAGFVPLPSLDLKHRFIRGNHDSPDVCRRSQNWIADGTVETIGSARVLFCGGAWSSDQWHRTEGVSWWRDEECSQPLLHTCIDLAESHRPDVVITHDCPRSILSSMFGSHTHHYQPSRTNQALDAVFDLHRPRLWIFGHHHISVRRNILGTEFICLAELNYIDIGM